jgi:hypothetical protein
LKPATLADVSYSKSPEIESQRDETRTPKKTCPESVCRLVQAQDVAEDNLSQMQIVPNAISATILADNFNKFHRNNLLIYSPTNSS